MKAKLIKKKDGWYNLYQDNIGIGSTHSELQGYKLSLKNCQAIERGYDLDELADKANGYLYYDSKKEHKPLSFDDGYKAGFQKAVELLGDKKYTKYDMSRMMLATSEWLNSEIEYGSNDLLNKVIQSLQQTEWDVEIVFDKDCYSSNGRCDKSEMANCIICTPVTYLKDVDGCLILKRI